MQYKIESNITNSIGGSRVLIESELESLTDGVVDAGGVALLAGEEMSISCDLLNRYSLHMCRYYYSGDGIVIMEVAEAMGFWIEVNTTAFYGGLEADLSSYFPRWLRITHYVLASAQVYAVELYNADQDILFGPQGQFLSYGMDVSGLTVQPVALYNNSLAMRDISVFVESDDSILSDEVVAVGLTSSGVFYPKHSMGIFLPDDILWDAGMHDGTLATVSGHLTLSGSLEIGTYYSPVFMTSSGYMNRFFWEQDHRSNSYVDYAPSVDSEDCFGVRRSNIPPSYGWVSGELASELDAFWSISIGSLQFEPVPNESILELRDKNYIQFAVTLSGSTAPYIYKAGVETPLTLSGIYPGQYRNVFLSLGEVAVSTGQLNLVCIYKE